MRELQLKSHRFRAEREADWRKLDQLLQRAERGVTNLTDDELVAVPVLYRSALSSLSVARATSLDQGVVDYLESLCARAYFFVYGARSTLLERVTQFFRRDWPRAVQGLWRETLVSFGLTVLTAVVAGLLVGHDPDWFYSFIPAELAGGRDPTASTAFLRDGLYHGEKSGLAIFATALFTHNAQIGLFAFALGFAFGVPTALLIAANGCMLGAILALYIERGLGFEFGGWLMIHGVTELSAVILAGAAGFRIGWSFAFPGKRSRMDAAAAAGRQAATVAAGVVVMLFVAGMLEGFARQLVTNDLARWGVALTSLIVWGVYLYFPRGGTYRAQA